MIFSWLRARRRKKLLALPFPEEWQQYLDSLPFYTTLNSDEKKRLKDILRIIIDEKIWEGCDGVVVTDEMKVVIAAHGNSLRALVKYLDNISDEEILKLNIPTGIPLVYELDDDLKPLNHYYLGDPEVIKSAIDSVAKQTKK